MGSKCDRRVREKLCRGEERSGGEGSRGIYSRSVISVLKREASPGDYLQLLRQTAVI